MAKKPAWKRNCSTPKLRNKRNIFLVYRDIFVGDRLKMKRFDEVRKIVDDHADETRRYIGDMKTRTICDNIIALLQAGWFQPNSGARTYLAQFFPTRLYEPNPKIVAASRATKVDADDFEEMDEDVDEATEEDRSSEFNPEDESEIESEDDLDGSTFCTDDWSSTAFGDSVRGHEIDLASDIQKQNKSQAINTRSRYSLTSGSREIAGRQPSADAPTPHQSSSTQPCGNQTLRKQVAVVLIREEDSRVVLGDNETNRLQNRQYQLGTYEMPSNPTYLPYKLQHILLTSTQKLLEECCFHFSRKWVPYFLEERGWDTPEAGELTFYWKATSPVSVPGNAVSIDQPLGPLLHRIKVIRNAAVHRQQKVPLVTLEAMLTDAVALASSLRDDKIADQILHWQRKLKNLVARMETDLATQREVKEREIEDIRQQKEVLYRELNALEKNQIAVEHALDTIGKSPTVVDAELLTALEDTFGFVRGAQESSINGDSVDDFPHQQSDPSSSTTTRPEIDLSNAPPVRLPPKRRSDSDVMITPRSITPSRRSPDAAGSSQASGGQNAPDGLDFEHRPLKRRKLFCTSASPGPITRSMAKQLGG